MADNVAVAKEKLSTAMELLFICMLHLLIIEARPALVHLVTVSTEHHAALFCHLKLKSTLH